MPMRKKKRAILGRKKKRRKKKKKEKLCGNFRRNSHETWNSPRERFLPPSRPSERVDRYFLVTRQILARFVDIQSAVMIFRKNPSSSLAQFEAFAERFVLSFASTAPGTYVRTNFPADLSRIFWIKTNFSRGNSSRSILGNSWPRCSDVFLFFFSFSFFPPPSRWRVEISSALLSTHPSLPLYSVRVRFLLAEAHDLAIRFR